MTTMVSPQPDLDKVQRGCCEKYEMARIAFDSSPLFISVSMESFCFGLEILVCRTLYHDNSITLQRINCTSESVSHY